MAQRLKTDWILFLTVLTLVCFGLVMVYSASSFVAEIRKYNYSSTHFFVRQLGWAIGSFLVLLYCMRKDYRQWNNPKVAFAGLGTVMFLLMLVYITDGRHRWLHAGPLYMQPSELAKPALAIFLAFFLCRRMDTINERHTLGPLVVAVSVMALAVAIADFGTAVVLIAMAVAVMFVAGIDRRYLVLCGVLALIFGVGFIAMKPYRLMRAIEFVDKDHKLLAKIDPQGHILRYAHQTASTSDPGYQQLQAKIAVGSGGVTGSGPNGE